MQSELVARWTDETNALWQTSQVAVTALLGDPSSLRGTA